MRLSIQLYSLRAMPSLDDQLRLVHDAGLAHVEATTANYADAGLFKRLLDRYRLTVPTGHFGIDRLRDGFDATVELAKLLGMETLYIWGLPEAEKPGTAEGWRHAGRQLGAVAERLADHGLGFGFHNHDWELSPMADGRPGLAHLFDGAAGTPLKWQADIAWLARGGADVPALLSAHRPVLASAHLKDLAPPGTALDEEGWADFGAGILLWKDWMPMLREQGMDPLVVEHDAPNDPVRFLTASISAAKMLMRPA